jgi:GDP-4-dehydro-6-deoxy-D-mannose reductase
LRILVLGAAGFLGRHLVDHLLDLGHEVEAWSRRTIAPRERVTSRSVDLTELSSFERLEGPWDAAVHLAGHSVPGEAWSSARVRENVAIAANGLDHLARVSPGLRVVFVSSARVYADRNDPHVEEEPLGPTTLYGLSKSLSEAWARFRARDLELQIVRPFQHIGPSMPKGLLLPELLARISESSGPIEMRGADSAIDVLDVRDGVRGIAALLTVDAPSGEAWNLSSGNPRHVSEIALGLCARFDIEREIRFARGAAVPLVGNSQKLRTATGWSPERSFDETLDWIAWPEERP